MHWELTLNHCKYEFILATTCFIISCFCLTFGLTVNFFLKTNEYSLPLNLYIVWLPFDGFSLNWVLNYFYQFCFSVFGSIFVFIFLPVSLVAMNQICLHVDSAILMINDTNQILTNPSQIYRNSEIAIRLGRIIKMIEQVQDWQGKVQSLMKFNFLIEFTTLSLTLCVCIYSMVINFARSVVFMAILIVFLSRFYMYCWLGSRMLARFETLTAALYDTEWYLMDAKQQKTLQLIIVKAQNMKGFHGIFKSVNLETFQKVC